MGNELSDKTRTQESNIAFKQKWLIGKIIIKKKCCNKDDNQKKYIYIFIVFLSVICSLSSSTVLNQQTRALFSKLCL